MSRIGLFVFFMFWLTAGQAASVDFNRDIRPILSDRCFHCHGPDEHDRKGHIRLDLAGGDDGAYRTRKGSTGIKPGDLKKSEVWYRITTDDEDDVMPPADSHKKALTAEEKAMIRQWILDGAEYQDFWAFSAPKKVPPKKSAGTNWGLQPIDGYVMETLVEKGLKPRAEADKRTLLRRLTFDLTGLPPTLDEIHAFLADKRPNAYESAVERLLAKPQYGEHMARYWADLVRLSDTNGMHKDFHRDFSTYRDWVIRAYNDNLPFDQFIGYQLAGDLYENPSQDQLIASGFNRLHLIIDRGTALPEESLHKNVLDRVEAFGTAFLGLTVQCAQCHDHKYDPISQKEFYQFYAFFNNFDGKAETPPRPARGLQAPFIDLATPEQQRQLDALNAEKKQAISALSKAKKAKAKPPAIKKLDGAVRALDRKLRDATNRIPGAMVMKERAEPRPAHVLMRGAYDAPAEKVERNTPAFLPPLPPKDGPYDRADLAKWLVAPDHPLTARVVVNRIWQQFFGIGLSKTPADFGAQGEWPSHPKLLDSLTVDFVESGWDIKKMVRQIVTSATYRQSSDAETDAYVADPDNRLLARGARYRMDAEMIRDQILQVSGKLNPKMYGGSVKPPQPPGLWASVSMTNQKFKADAGDAIYRRSFYTYWKRAMPPPQMTILNAPSREACIARRERTNTPLQALVLMNEPEYFKLTTATAERVLAESKGAPVATIVERLYETMTSHVPSPARKVQLVAAHADFAAYYGSQPKLAAAIAPNAPADKQADLAAWTMLTHSLLNLELTKVRR